MEEGRRRLPASMNCERRRPSDLLHTFDGRKINEELDKINLDATAFDSFVLLEKIPNDDVFRAWHADEVDRLMFMLIDFGLVNINARGCWDTFAHYYDCLSNQFDDAQMLLESDAICSDHSFDDDKCQYSVKKLLKAFEARAPPTPLGLFEATLRDT
ncbi:hypothetical protein Ddye_016870 [Dipteronia dyeriana]|uniref:Uncharacterized protein n=1 Tax=Dipteronia dyeriana TaxID=168575 RepID=A0AAD9WZZ6_9ROSI|nr:hypothetical protein Ddye_016870 [Dipteronia dyeriana]